jgi:hypothetical protein
VLAHIFRQILFSADLKRFEDRVGPSPRKKAPGPTKRKAVAKSEPEAAITEPPVKKHRGRQSVAVSNTEPDVLQRQTNCSLAKEKVKAEIEATNVTARLQSTKSRLSGKQSTPVAESDAKPGKAKRRKA